MTSAIAQQVRACLSLGLVVVVAWTVVQDALIAAEVAVDEKLIEAVRSGHDRLVHSAEHVSGRITKWRGPYRESDGEPFSREGLSAQRETRFFVSAGSLRMDYLRSPSPSVSQDKREDIVEILVATQDKAWRYTGVVTPGDSAATLHRYADPLAIEVYLRISSELRFPITSLFSLSGVPVLDFLQRPGVTAEKKVSPDGTDLLVIKGTDSSNAQETTFSISLDVKKNHAIRRFDSATDMGDVQMRVTGFVESADFDQSARIPKQAAMSVLVERDGTMDVKTSFREIVQINVESLVPPQGHLFTEGAFSDLGRPYTIVDVDNRGATHIGQTVRPPPHGSQFRPAPPAQRSRWLSLVMINTVALAVIIALLLRRKLRSK